MRCERAVNSLPLVLEAVRLRRKRVNLIGEMEDAMRKREERGFTLLELLVVVAIIAIVATIAIVNYRASIDRAKQRRTLNDMRVIAGAWEARAADTQSYLIAGYTFPPTAVSYDAVDQQLSPTYARTLPRMDGWGHPYDFGFTGPKDYAIRSAGRDGIIEGSEYTQGETDDPDCDIVYSSGGFVTFPVALKGK